MIPRSRLENCRWWRSSYGQIVVVVTGPVGSRILRAPVLVGVFIFIHIVILIYI